MRVLKRASFAGREFQFWSYDEAGVLEIPGVEHLKGVADHPEGAANATWWTFEDEAEVRERHWKVGPEDEVLDVGAAFGSYTLSAAAQGARVHALEPSLFCRSILLDNVAANPELAERISVKSFGTHSRDGFFDPEVGRFVEPEEPTPSWALRVRPVDATFQGVAVTVMKLDVEGAELEVLRGAEGVIRARRPRLLIEEHEFKQAGIGKECETFLAALGVGYRLAQRVNHGAVEHGYYEAPR